MSRLSLAWCLALTLACNASAVERRLRFLQALMGVPIVHVPQMLMTHDQPGHELPVLDAVLLSVLVAVFRLPSRVLSETAFLVQVPPAAPARRRAKLRGPPVSSAA